MASKDWQLVLLTKPELCSECCIGLASGMDAYYDPKRDIVSCYSHVRVISRAD